MKLTQKAQEKQLGERLDHERQVRRHEELMNAARNADSLLREFGTFARDSAGHLPLEPLLLRAFAPFAPWVDDWEKLEDTRWVIVALVVQAGRIEARKRHGISGQVAASVPTRPERFAQFLSCGK
ncbi:hypothetical protein [Nesterenkonia sp. PF2B19]|uniref:hypothetical protein n=1 Tax=Nesterenkonia sp. PF2B19 TaxID=1881858 RepID=UPI00111C9185|nr:hypothetical protein [Nesterenkonia sp. PF2B19]